MQSPHPVATGSEAVDNPPNGAQQLHPEPRTGCNRRANGVQLAHERGAAVAPEPSWKPSWEPAAPAREALHTAEALGDEGPMGEFFAALGPDWQLTAAQRARLGDAVTTALNAGWTPRALAAFTASCRRRSRSDRPGRRGAANAIEPPGCSALMATRHARALTASRRPE